MHLGVIYCCYVASVAVTDEHFMEHGRRNAQCEFDRFVILVVSMET